MALVFLVARGTPFLPWPQGVLQARQALVRLSGQAFRAALGCLLVPGDPYSQSFRVDPGLQDVLLNPVRLWYQALPAGQRVLFALSGLASLFSQSPEAPGGRPCLEPQGDPSFLESRAGPAPQWPLAFPHLLVPDSQEDLAGLAGQPAPSLQESLDYLWCLAARGTHFPLFYPLPEGRVAPRDPEGPEGPSPPGVQELRSPCHLSCRSHQGFPARQFLPESPEGQGLPSGPVVQVSLEWRFQRDQGVLVGLVAPGVLVSRPGQCLLLPHLALCPLASQGGLVNLASPSPTVLAVPAFLVLLGVRDFHNLVFLVVQLDLGTLEVQGGLVGQEHLALFFLIRLKDTTNTQRRG